MAANTGTKASATQEFVPIEEVRDGIVVLKDGSMRGIFMASSLNIALKSEPEQEAILYQFQNFLNSLDFTVQIFVQSRELDIRPYVTLLEGRLAEQTNDLMKIQVREYIEFVKSLTEGTNIMTKSFFIIVPYAPPFLEAKGGGALSGISSMFGAKAKQSTEQKNVSFEENRSQLEQRMSIVEGGLSRTGVRVAQLSTEEVIELFYKIFNIGELERPIPLQTNR